MEPNYRPQAIEKAVQDFWTDNKTFHAKEDFSREKFFCLAMIPYPSGYMHVGHVRNYTIADVIARYQHMLGKNVMQPVGWDAFGLPAENAALKNKTAPAKWTYANIDHMRKQLKGLGYAYDWSREVTTCDPEYYKWEQWLFLRMFEKGLAYKKLSSVNWDPVDQTVLANEQVIDGKGWRSGATVEKREIPQWFLKITDYADELVDSLDELDEWPEQVKTMQRNWVGRSHGANIQFNVDGYDTPLEIYTTRADTLFGATYLCIASEHPLAIQAAKGNKDLQNFINELKQSSTSESDLATQQKLGMATGFNAKHPISGEEIPVWVANYVLANYGSGAVMAVPAHDERDHEFAKKYQLEIKAVVNNKDGSAPDISDKAFGDYGTLTNSGSYDGLSSEEAKKTITEKLIEQGAGSETTKYRLHDWGVSRQRFWGAPIPIINCDDCGPVAVPQEDLPIQLPEKVDFTQGIMSLADMPEFYKTICPSCGKNAKRETDTFDTFMESSWYYARMACSDQTTEMLDARANYWTPVDQYVGGIEHAVMHLLYARFIHKVLRDEKLLNTNEPFNRLLTQGMVLKDGIKMSKSKGNTVDPDELVKEYGADSVRLFAIFTAPPEQSLEWSDNAFEGCFRFLKRLWAFGATHQSLFENEKDHNVDWSIANNAQLEQWREMNLILKQASYDFERQQLNTVVSGAMKLFNLIGKIETKEIDGNKNAAEINHALIHIGFRTLLLILAPIAPHICQQLWQELNFGKLIVKTQWPQVSEQALETQTVSLVIQVNGKLRSKLTIAKDASKEAVEAAGLADESVQRHTQGKTIRKVIVIPNKLINIVVTD
jgi:leucyl-tRNA synthetase